MIEILVVIAVIVILTVAMVKISQNVSTSAKIKVTQSTIQVLCAAVEEYSDYHDAPPPSDVNDGSLYSELYKVPKCRKILDKLPEKSMIGTVPDITIIDAWGIPLDYTPPADGNPPQVYSAGPDEIPENADDIRSNEL